MHLYNVQITVGAYARVLEVTLHWPGSVHDARIFANSMLKTYLDNNLLCNGPSISVLGVPV